MNTVGMTDVAGAVEALAFDYENYVGSDGLQKSMAAWDAQQECLNRHDREAREAGKICGRNLRFPQGDGHAIYEICAVRGRSAYLRWVSTGDNWRSLEVEGMAKTVEDPFYEGDGAVLFKVPLKFVEERIQHRDAFSQLFKSVRADQ